MTDSNLENICYVKKPETEATACNVWSSSSEPTVLKFKGKKCKDFQNERSSVEVSLPELKMYQ